MKTIILIILLVVIASASVQAVTWDYIGIPWYGFDPTWGFWGPDCNFQNAYSSATSPWNKMVTVEWPYYYQPPTLIEHFTFKSETRSASFRFGPVSGTTKLPYPDQIVEYWSQDNLLLPAAYAKLDIEAGETVAYSGGTSTNIRYEFTFSAAGDNLGTQFDPKPLHYPNTINSTGGNGLLDSSIYNQLGSTYGSVKYANSNYTFADYACYFLCTCKNLNELGLYFDPLELHSWLKANKGFSGLRVDPAAVVRWALKVKGVNIGFTRNISLEEALMRGFKVHCSVKNKGHWVKVVGFSIARDGTIKIIIADPANGRHRFLEDYSGVDKNNNRCFYKKAAPVKPTVTTAIAGASLAIIDAKSTKSSLELNATSNDSDPINPTVSLGTSSMSIFSMSQVEMTLKYQGAEIATSSRESLESAQTGAIIDTGSEMTVESAQTGEYELVLTGVPGTLYQITVRDYDYASDMKEKTYSGTIPSEGIATVVHTHFSGIATNNVSDIMSYPDGTNILLTGGIVTGGNRYWLQVQKRDSIVPTLNVKLISSTSSSNNPFGYEVAYLPGKIKIDKGVRSIVATDIVYLKTRTGQMPKPVGVNLASLNSTKGVYSKIWGKITYIGNMENSRDYIKLDDKVTVKLFKDLGGLPYDYKVGDMIAANGIVNGSMFYVGSLNDIQKLQ